MTPRLNPPARDRAGQRPGRRRARNVCETSRGPISTGGRTGRGRGSPPRTPLTDAFPDPVHQFPEVIPQRGKGLLAAHLSMAGNDDGQIQRFNEIKAGQPCAPDAGFQQGRPIPKDVVARQERPGVRQIDQRLPLGVSRFVDEANLPSAKVQGQGLFISQLGQPDLIISEQIRALRVQRLHPVAPEFERLHPIDGARPRQSVRDDPRLRVKAVSSDVIPVVFGVDHKLELAQAGSPFPPGHRLTGTHRRVDQNDTPVRDDAGVVAPGVPGLGENARGDLLQFSSPCLSGRLNVFPNVQ